LPAVDAWTTPTLAANWSNYGSGFAAAGYYRDPLGVVWVRGLVVAAAGAGEVVFTLPTGYRPSDSLIFSSICSKTTTELARLDVRSNGEVRIVVPAAAIAWVSLACSFRAA
jgi:hypothetical protein